MEQTQILNLTNETKVKVTAVRQDIFEISGKVKKEINAISKFSTAAFEDIKSAPSDQHQVRASDEMINALAALEKKVEAGKRSKDTDCSKFNLSQKSMLEQEVWSYLFISLL